MSINKASTAVSSQTPDFIQGEHELFAKFIEYYYLSQEKTGLGQNIVNNFLQYMDIDSLQVEILDGATKLVEDIDNQQTTIAVESIDEFLPEKGSVLINDEVIFYENTIASPNVALSPGISYEQVKLKWVELQSPLFDFDGTTRIFPLRSQDNPIVSPSANHLVVRIFGQYYYPGIDFTVSGTNIVFTTAPRAYQTSDGAELTSIFFLSGFVEQDIITLDDISPSFGDAKTEFKVTNNGLSYIPEVDEYIVAYYDHQLLIPKIDFVFDKDVFIFRNIIPLKGRKLTLLSIEAPIPSFGTGASAYARVSDTGQLSSIVSNKTGSGYRFEFPPKITITSSTENGTSGAAEALINGIKDLQLLNGGVGYSDTNPPTVIIQEPTQEGSSVAVVKATVTGGSISSLNLENSGNGYTFVPRISFRQPGGAEIGPITIVNGSISTPPTIVSKGQGYTTAPRIYVDAPTGTNSIPAVLTTTINSDGEVTAVTVVNGGQGFESVPRAKIIQPTGAQVLETIVDNDGRVTNIEILDGGSGYDDIPSVYIIDDRVSNTGTYLGGSGAKAVASIFNGRITDINITEFGTGYSQENPPKVVIQAPPQASASADIGVNEITGYNILQAGREYEKAQLLNCARAASAIVDYTEDGNAVFSNNTIAASATDGADVKCLDALFIKRVLDKYTEQYLPDVPELDYKTIDVRTAIKNIRSFYQTKGTSFSIAYLFKLLYGEDVSISYPKEQIIRPSAATWSISTILRATLESGDPRNIQDALITQDADIADVNVRAASALVENYIAIETANTTIYELVLSEETINGNFVVPYKTKLAEPLDDVASIVTVDSTIGWPERNGEFVLGGIEVVRYKEKSLNQFIECTRGFTGTIGEDIARNWDSGTEVVSNFKVYLNKGTPQEVVMNIVGIVDAQQTTLTDTGSYYLPGDKLTVAKLGGTGDYPLLTTWLYNVKKLLEVETITYGGDNNQTATVVCSNNHGLLVGDQVTVYGANPILYNGTFTVTSRVSDTSFKYQLPQTALVVPQGNILISVDLNKGKSTDTPINNNISSYTTNVQNSFFNDDYVYVASTGIPNYNVGPFTGSALIPGNQRKLNRFPQNPTTISTKTEITPGPIGTWVNGVSIWSYKSPLAKTFGPVTSISINNAGQNYDAASPPNISINNGGGTGASASVVVNGSVTSIEVESGGSGYTSSPLVSIVGGGGSGASATAIITKGVVSNILITDGGTGYTSQPTITVVGGEGTGATATASVRGPIKEVNLLSGGSSYTSTPDIVLSSGSGAVAQAIVNNGRIISIAIISAGQSYTTAPEVQIQGDGFGAKARAVIDTEGENAGRVTSIEILNRGIGYTQGTTVISLQSIGQDAVFSANVFQWSYNLRNTASYDTSQGSVFEGYNNQYGGEYAHLYNPQRLRFILGDNLIDTGSTITEQETQLTHSPIIGWAFDGNPIYGPYGYEDPTDQSSTIIRIRTSYSLKDNLVYNEITNPNPVRVEGSLLSVDPAGTFINDYEYEFSLGDLDQYNGRFCKTPEFPNGRYCYFVTIDNTEAGNPVYPYIVGPSFNSVVDTWNLRDSAIQQNIPTGVVRYRDPYENVDIDVERTPNASTNTLTLENGDILLFEVEDENRDGVISEAESNDPDQILEEPPLQIFDYFPKVKTESKVDIEVETTTKFENASITGFVIENAGQSYQVNDKLIFDNSDTGGSGASARVSRIKGETISSYNYEYLNGVNYGIVQTQNPHNLVPGDSVFVDYTENLEDTNKTYVVRQIKGIEEVVITQTGSGYNEDIPPTITIDGDGESGELQAVVDSVGAIKTVNIINSGNSYTENPRVILSHPQIFKKADYYNIEVDNLENVKINDVVLNSAKEAYICGKTLNATGDTIAFISKISAGGVKEWEKSLELTSGVQYAEFQKILVDGKTIWAVGINKPNTALLDSYNPDIIIAKYTESTDGLSATLVFQRSFAGISGGTRSDNITSILKYGDDNVVITGYTNTNSSNPFDGFVGVLDNAGTFTVKRKIASSTLNEKVIGSTLSSTNELYLLLETSVTANAADKSIVLAKTTVGTQAISIDWIKEVSNNVYSFLDASIAIDEFDEIYLSATLQLKSDDTTRDSFWVGKFNNTGTSLWSKRYVAPGRDINLAPKTNVDIFNQLNIAYTREDNTTNKLTVNSLKLTSSGTIANHTSNDFNQNNIEGVTVLTLDTDVSGDPYLFGQTSWNRNEAIFDFNGDILDATGHHLLSLVQLSGSVAQENDVLKILGYQSGNAATVWENSAAKILGTSLGSSLGGDFVIDFFIYKDDDNGNAETLAADQQTLLAIGDATDATGGLWLYYNTDGSANDGRIELVIANNTTQISAASAATGTNSNLFANDTWQLITLTKTNDLFKVFVNGIEQISGTVTNTALGSKDIHIGNIPGFAGAGGFVEGNQGQFFLDSLRIRNRAVTPTVPSDITALPVADAFALGYTWTDTAWFTQHLARYDYIDYVGFGLKVDKDADAVRIGVVAPGTNTDFGYTRASITPVTGSDLSNSITGYGLGEAGLQALDYSDANTTMTQDSVTLTYARDIWSSRTATVPSPGSQKLKVTANVKNRYFFKTFNLTKIDNILELTLNQSAVFTVGSKLVLRNGAQFVNSGYITSVDYANRKVRIAVINNSWDDNLNQHQLSTEQFSEQSSYGIIGPVPNDINEIKYTFSEIVNTTPGTFDIDLSTFDAPSDIGGTNNLDEYGFFKTYSDDDYSIRIDEVSGSSPFIVGSVITLNSGDITFNNAYSTAQITNLTGVTKITLITNLTKIVQATAIARTDTVYAISDTLHYLADGSYVFVDGNPTREISGVFYDEYDGSFSVDRVISPLEFTYKLPQVAQTEPNTSAGSVSVFVKSPVLKMYYGHQYLFDLSHSSMAGGNLSFSKDPLYKLEYSFNSIERIGTPGVTGQGLPSPSVKLKVEQDIVTNISYYFDPSRPGADSPVIANSYLDVTFSPYVGTFVVSSTSGGTITRGDDTFRFPLINQPEGPANINNSAYATSSRKAVGSISNIRIVNPGGFYTKLPVITGLQSTRNIERVQIVEPGTEYAVGRYDGVPINGDGEGGLVSITVADGTDDEGVSIPGQIQSVVVTSPGKGYTTATIDIESISGILGAGLTGSGAELNVVIPPFGTGASIFTLGEEIGKIKNLKNNNFGFDYPHDYTLRPEISFPLNAQLTSTSILDSITVTDPGSGYTQAPAVVITGGGGQNAIAEASIKNGRLSAIEVKDPGQGYSSAPTVELKSSFNYVINTDLGLLQFAFPHGIQNGAEVTLNVIETADGQDYPLASGAVGRLNGTTTYYAISGSANSLEDDQLKLAITPQNAELGDGLTFINGGNGRQQVLTSSFGGSATANVITSTFLEGELVYQGDSIDNASATGYVSTNSGWQIGPRIIKIVNYTGNFEVGQTITGVISKSSGVISTLKIAKGVLEVGSITKTTGQFIDDVGKPSEIVQKIQDSYYYQDFSYAIKSGVSISDWKDILIRNVHPASFKVFGELSLSDFTTIPNKETDFQLTKSVELANQAIVPNIQNFTLVEPVYREFDNTEVLFRQKRLTSSENILTSVVQRLDDVSGQFDGVKRQFPLTVNNGDPVIANANQLMIILNGVVQTPEVAFEIQGDSIVFSEPPQPPASVKYVSVTIDQINTTDLEFTSISGIFPNIGNQLTGTASSSRFTVTKVVGNTISGFFTEGTAFQPAELVLGNTTGFSALFSTATAITNNGLFIFGESITNLEGNTAVVEEVNLEKGAETPIAKLRYSVGLSTTSFEVVAQDADLNAPTPPATGTFVVGKKYQIGSELVTVTDVTENNDSFTVVVTRGVDGTASTGIQASTPFYGTDITITDLLVISKTTGTYQSTPGLYDIITDDVIVAAQSGVVARVTFTEPYRDPYTGVVVSTEDGQAGAVEISEGSSFFGLLFDRIASTTYPNVVLDDISASQVSVVEFGDNVTDFNAKFPENELVTNYVIPYDNATGTFQEDEFIRNYKIEYGNSSGDYQAGEELKIKRLTLTNEVGDGFFSLGHTIKTRDTKAEVIGYNQAKSLLYLGKIGRCKPSGEDYHTATFVAGAQLNAYNKKFGVSALALSKGTSPHTFVSATADSITADTTSTFTAATGTTYDPETGNLVLEIGSHSLTTANTVTITDETIVFTCSSDNNTNNYSYPRSTDPASGSARAITATTATTITVNVGAVPVDEYLTIPTASEFGFATGVFTVECWIKPNYVSAGSRAIFDFRTTATELSPYLYLDGDSLKYYVNGSAVITGATNLVAGTWYHVALSRSGNTTKLFLDGVQEGSDYGDNNNYGITKPLTIGAAFDASSVFAGYIDEVRVSNLARYTAAFTPRNGTFQGDINTLLLLHFDGPHNATYTQDWSGTQDFTLGEFFNNGAIPETTRVNGGAVVAGYTGNSQRYYDAANLLEKNKNFLAKEVVYLLTQQYPSLVIPGGNVNCEDDVVDIVEAIVEDLRNGSNNHIWDASALYVDRTTPSAVTLNHIETEIDETVWAYNKLGDLIPYIINNVLWTVSGSHGLKQFTDVSITDSNNTTYTEFTAATGTTYNSATGDMVLEIGTHSLTTSDQIYLKAGSLVFTCDSDADVTQHKYPRSDDPAYNAALKITATTATTITVNVGASPVDQQYTHTFVSASANSVVKLNYTTGDCADVASTADNLLDILIDTLTNANLGTPVDHLGSVTKVSPAIEFTGATVDAFLDTELSANYVDGPNDIFYANRIGSADLYRFKDAANLLRLNRTAIVDKAAADMISRYPDLNLSMPRNTDGSGAGTLRCKTDLGLLLDALAKDLEFGGNKNSLTGAKFYVGVNNRLQHIRLQVWQSAYAHDRLGYYAKQAINGDLDQTNTDALIVGDWGITNDAGQCANVQTAIDNIITAINDIICPTAEDFNVAADRLYFNRNFIAEEATGLLDAEFTYVLDNITYRAFDYPNGTAGREKCQRDLKLIIVSIISDLQTGGNNSTIEAIELYLNANLQLDHIEEQLAATIFGIESMRTLGLKAVENLLRSSGTVATGDQYAGIYATSAAYVDSESMTDVEEVKARFGELLDIAVRMLSPGGKSSRFASQQLLFNKNYYRTEIAQLVNGQFGANSWSYDDFLDGLVDNLSHDIISTDTGTSNIQSARRIDLGRDGIISELQFTGGAGYRSVPTISITAPASGTQATATAALTAAGPFDSFNITAAGSGYTFPPVVQLSGSNVQSEFATATLNGSGAVTALTYDGYVWNSDDFTNVDAGAESQDSGTGTTATDGFATGVKYIRFGAANGLRQVETTAFDTTDYDKIRLYLIAGNGSNGGDAPEAGDDLVLEYSTDQRQTWTTFDTLIYGDSTSSTRPRTDFASLTPVTFNLTTATKNSQIYFRIRQTNYGLSLNEDHYGMTRLGLIDDDKNFEGIVTLTFSDAPAESNAGRTVATADFQTLRAVDTVTITNPGKGYDPSNPPTATFSGGNPNTAATFTNVNVVFDTSLFTVGETITNGTATAVVLEDIGSSAYIGTIVGTFAAGDTLTGNSSGTTAEIPSGGVSAAFNYYTKVGNALTFNDARLITSPVEAEFSTTNLWTNPEAYQVNWSLNSGTVGFNANAGGAPDNTVTADRLYADTTTGFHTTFRTYTLSSSNTFDDGTITFDSGTNTFDEGSLTQGENQTFTSSFFVKADQFNRIRNLLALDYNTAGQQRLFFDIDLTNGDISGSIFQPENGLTIEDRGVTALDSTTIAISTVASMTGSYTAVAQTDTSLDGNGATFDVTIDHANAPNTAVVTLVDKGSDYRPGETLTISGQSLGGTNIQNDLTIDVSTTERQGIGVIPFGNGWYRVYATITFSFGFSEISQRIVLRNTSGQDQFTGDGTSGVLLWGAKLNKGVFDAYTAVGGEVFYSNLEYNVKKYALDILEEQIEDALDGTLTSPAPNSSFLAFDNSTWRTYYNTNEILRITRANVDLYRKQLDDATTYLTLAVNSGFTVPTKEYGIGTLPIGITGEVGTSDFVYGEFSNVNGELETIFLNESKIAKVYKRFRIDGDITDGPFTMGEAVEKQGDDTITGVVYGFHEDENYKYLDVEVTGGTWSISDTIEGQANTTTAVLSAIEDRLHVIQLKGTYTEDIPFLGYTSSATATPTSFIRTEAAVLDNSGGKLTVDTETLVGTFEKTSVVYAGTTEMYLEVQRYDGLEVEIGDRIISGGYTRLGVNDATGFTVGHFIYGYNGGRDTSKQGIITGVDTVNNYVYYAPILGTFAITDQFADFGFGTGGAFAEANQTINTKVEVAGAASARINNIVTVGTNKRLYLVDIVGTWSENDSVIAQDDYKSVVLFKVLSRGRTKRASRGFDGVQTTFDLTIANGTSYLPDPAGHMLIFVNGILQPPGAGNAYNAFSDKIQFSEPPDIGSTFTGFYVGKLRQLDDISFEFDSLRQSFNLKRDDVFYSLTLTEGVQSTTITPENNIIVSLNGVIQEPGIGFEIVGSRIIFTEIPRVGSTFAAFSYVGSEADVDAAEVVPPIEPGDFIEIQGETEDREVAVIESSNSLITFDYLGSVFGQNADASAVLTKGFLDKVVVTAPGSGYTSRPVVRVDSISGFNASIRAIVGINVVDVTNSGSGYKNPDINVETTVPDDWTPPNLADYGEELVDHL